MEQKYSFTFDTGCNIVISEGDGFMKFIGLEEKYLKAVLLTAEHLKLNCDKTIEFKASDDFKVYSDNENIVIEYSEICEVFRGLSFVERVINEDIKIEQKSLVPNRGTMIDCSRNAVMNMEHLKEWVITTATFGINQLYLYMEDTYTIDEYPYFGHKRGRYTKEEIKELDVFAKQFGITLIPQIQTLGHLMVLKDWDCFSSLWDILDILMVDEDATYEFIENEIKAIRECFTADTLHIGIDEAHLMGRGKYMDKHGYKETIPLLVRHIKRVSEICSKYGFRPIIDTDLLFHLKYDWYWKKDNKFTDEMLEMLPEDVIIAYWDYYYQPSDIDVTDNMFKIHAETGREVLYTCGAWNWWGFTPKNFYSNFVTQTQCATAIKYGVKTIKISTFGDDGAECPAFAVLPAMLRTAEQFYGNENDVERRSLECFGVSFEDFMKIDTVCILGTEADYSGISPSALEKSVFYNDIMMGLMNEDIRCYNLTEKYTKDLEILNSVNAGKYDYLFETQRKFAEFLIVYAELPIKIKEAYKNNNKNELDRICKEEIPKALELLKKFEAVFNAQWHKVNKPFGYDVQQLRIGGMMLRIEGSKARIESYINGEIDCLEELECEDLPFKSKATIRKGLEGNWRKSFTRSIGIN